MTVLVSTFFAPCAPKRPANFIVLKYFLLGLLISNSIESILIIPKILDVLDQSAIQATELEKMDIRRAELKELVAEKEKEARELQKETERELKVLLEEKGGSKNQHQDESEEEEEEEQQKHHMNSGKGRQGKEHHGKKSHHASGKHDKKDHNKQHPEVRKRPQRMETGNNLVAVFMLFYGSATLCLGVPAIFKESVQLLRVLMYLSCLGTMTLVSAKFSLIMLMSVVKDMAIAALTFQYVQMIVASNPPAEGSTAGQTASMTAATAGAMPQAGVNPFPTAATNVAVDYSQPATGGYNPTGQTGTGW